MKPIRVPSPTARFRRPRAGISAGLLGLFLGMAAPAATAADGRVSLRQLREPVEATVRELCRQTDLALRVDENLKDTKVVVIIHDRPAEEVLSRLAQVLGAEWVAGGAEPGLPAGTPVRVLKRLASVERWRLAWLRDRAGADAAARGAQRGLVRETLRQVLDAVDRPDARPELGGTLDMELARFLKTLPPAALDRVAEQIGNSSPVRAGGRSRPQAPAVRAPFRQLTPPQQKELRNWLHGRSSDPNDYNSRLLQALDQSVIALTSTDGMTVEVQITAPDRPAPSSFTVFGRTFAGEKLAEFSNEALHARLAGRPTPAEALLGARMARAGQAEPRVVNNDPRMDLRLPRGQEPPLRWQFLARVADELKLSVVADHVTLSDRLQEPEQPLSRQLDAAALAYRTVFRVENDYLLARRVSWPEDETREARWPHVEHWIDRKEQAARSGNRAAALPSLEELGTLAGLPDEQIDTLAEYRDPLLPVSFEQEEQAARADDRRRGLLRLLAGFDPAKMARFLGAEGLPVRELSLEAQNFLTLGVPAAKRAEVARGRLRASGVMVAGRVPGLEIVIAKPGDLEGPPLAVIARVAPLRLSTPPVERK